MGLTEWPAYARLALPISAASGSRLELEGGRDVLDLYGGHCVNTLGAGDAGILAGLVDQWQRLSFATNLFDHAPRAEFLAAFGRNLPPGDWIVFASNSGAEANENALKAALAATGRTQVVCFEGAFHGRTAAASAVSDVASSGYPRAPFDVVRLPWGDLDRAAHAITGEVGCVLLEPIMSMAGVVEPPPGFLEGLRGLCDATGAQLVFDEVQTGNGRLGTPWASQHFGVLPDLFTTAKGAGAGLPIGLTVARPGVAASAGKGFLGSTFGGGPLVLAAAAHVARRIAAPGLLEGVKRASAALRAAALRGPVQGVRGVGLLLGLELAPGLEGPRVRDQLLERGVLVGTSGDPAVLRLSPALTLEAGAAERLAAALEAIPMEVLS
jgi:acetylornithine/succinyldiaminopimelate/putrescine aminotransferase